MLAAFTDGALVGTVQVILAVPPNQPHRGEIAKLLGHRSARRRGIAQLHEDAVVWRGRIIGVGTDGGSRSTGDERHRGKGCADREIYSVEAF